jgi:hypothetical protein
MSNHTSFVAEAVATYIAEHGRVQARDVLAYLEQRHGRELAEFRQHLFEQGLLKLIKDALKKTGLDDGVHTRETEEQLLLPGYKPPTTLPIPQADGDFLYVRWDLMTELELKEAIALRKQSILRDQDRLEDLEQKWELLRPYFRRHKGITVGAATQLYLRAHKTQHA